ncbi:unnamed protein product [Moneuplotes crassus]|uniref:J domain-containing protein n=1 Tax=Euplotes crassus TaxID=5936 RepID=A0AAD1XH07_EUPCR|nr:unnamed protein product [Moneuplotes crassus]
MSSQIQYDKKNDAYKLLEVSETAKTADIKKSYFKLAKKHHPDLATGNEMLFKRINNAYEILKDDKTRIQYDEIRNQTLSGKSSSSRSYGESYQGSSKQNTSSRSRYQHTRQNYGSYYSDFSNDHDFSGFYTKKDYKRTTQGANYDEAKRNWENRRRQQEQYQRDQQKAYQKYESSQKNNQSNYKSYYRDTSQYSGSYGEDNAKYQQEKAEQYKRYKKFYDDFKDSKFYKENFDGFESKFTQEKAKRENMYEKWKKNRKASKPQKKYGKYTPSKYSPFYHANRVKMMRILGKYTNFYKIINIRQGKTDRLFMDALRAFKRRTNKETINRGFLTFKDFSRMFPIKAAVATLFGMSCMYNAMIRMKI